MGWCHFSLRQVFVSVALMGATLASCTQKPGATASNSSLSSDSATILDAAADPDGHVTMMAPLRERSMWIERQDSMMSRDTVAAAAFKKWLSQLDRYKHASLYEKALAVDNAVDRAITWTDDSANYHGAYEYFAPPALTLKRGKGDCEDFSTLKYEALRYLGVKDNRLYVMGVERKPGAGMDHAVLVIDTSRDANTSGSLVLDNVDKEKECRGVAISLWTRKYKPVFVVNRKNGYKSAGF